MSIRSRCAALSLCATVALPAVAVAQTVTATPGTQHVVRGAIEEAARGSSMTGMRLTASFDDNTTLTGTWGFLSTDFFGAFYGVELGDRLRVRHRDTDTFFPPYWNVRQLGGARVTSLTFDGAPGNTVFDRSFGFLGLGEGTPGSSLGTDFFAAFLGGTTARYTNVVSVAPSAPAGDLYATLTVDFANPLPRAGATFLLDTDRVEGRIGVVPEPSTYALMGTGLAGLLVAARRRTRA